MAPTMSCWHRPLGAPDSVRRLTIGRPCWSTAAAPPDRWHVLEVDCLCEMGFDVLDKLVPTKLQAQQLKRLRIIHRCPESVVRFFLERFDWTAIELDCHSVGVLSRLPISVVELRLVRGLSLDHWSALIHRGKEGLLLRHLWLGSVDQLDPAVQSKLLDKVLHDDSFAVYGSTDIIQWHSALNLWSHAVSTSLGRDDLSRVIRIIKDWKKRREGNCSNPQSTADCAKTTPIESSETAMKRKVYVCPRRR